MSEPPLTTLPTLTATDVVEHAPLAHPVWALAVRALQLPHACDDPLWDPNRDLMRLCSRPLCASVVAHLANDTRCATEWTCDGCHARTYCSCECRVAHAAAHGEECARWRGTSVGDIEVARDALGDCKRWWFTVAEWQREDLGAFVGCVVKGGHLLHATTTFWDFWTRHGGHAHHLAFRDSVAFAHLRVLLSEVARRLPPSVATVLDVLHRVLLGWAALERHLTATPFSLYPKHTRAITYAATLAADLLAHVDLDARPPPPLRHRFAGGGRESVNAPCARAWISATCAHGARVVHERRHVRLSDALAGRLADIRGLHDTVLAYVHGDLASQLTQIDAELQRLSSSSS